MPESNDASLARVSIKLTPAEKTEWVLLAKKYPTLSDMVRMAVRTMMAGLGPGNADKAEKILKVLDELKDIQKKNQESAREFEFLRSLAPQKDAPEELVKKVRLLVTHGTFLTGEIAFIVEITREEAILVLSRMGDLEQDVQTARWRVKQHG